MRSTIAVFAGVKEAYPGVTLAIHLCRATIASRFTGTRPYDDYAEVVFREPAVDRLLLEYDDYRSGDFDPRCATSPRTGPPSSASSPPSTRRSRAEDDLLRRIEPPAQFVPLDRLALSTQCGFASTEEGNAITPDDQFRKLELVVRVANKVWS